jgi:hypothetical protein
MRKTQPIAWGEDGHVPSDSVRPIRFQVQPGDVLTFPGDVLVVKYAQHSYGLDRAVLSLLSSQQQELPQMMPLEGDELVVATHGQVASTLVLFVGVEPLDRFGYQEIRSFARRAMRSLASLAPDARNVCLTVHGRGYGLDEAEAFKAEIAGLIDAINAGEYPPDLEVITFVEVDGRSAQRLGQTLISVLPQSSVSVGSRVSVETSPREAARVLTSVGAGSNDKQHVFVAMPFVDVMSDIFHYGIEPAVKRVASLCERADQAIFTGEIMAWVKDRISTAILVVADLTSANANVYLEVGYAWGRGIPTVLLAQDDAELKFDVKSQHCIVYKSIQDLETQLTRELAVLVP